MSTGFFELALIIGVAGLLGILMRLLRQPLLLAYLATGLLLSGLGFYEITSKEAFGLFSELGIMFLLFLVGLEINYTSLRTVGPTSVVVGLGQIVITFLIGWLVSLGLGFDALTGAYIAIALTFSSTIIIVKLLTEKRDLHSLYGKISIGFMLVQDLVAILILIALGGIERGAGIDAMAIAATVVKGVLLFGAMVYVGRRLVPYVFDRAARSAELLFLMTLAWVFIVVTVVSRFGFSIEIGGFLAGLALANSAEHFQVAGRVRPLRDFFIMIFFVLLGASLAVFDISGVGVPVLLFSLFVLIGNPLIVLVIMGLMGYRRRTSFLAGVTVAQISEFSLILAALGLRLGHIDQSAVALITWVGVITILLSTYLILHAEKIYRWIHHLLLIFERMRASEPLMSPNDLQREIVLIGASRVGSIVLQHLAPKRTLVVDFDPTVVERLKRHGVTVVLGDSGDHELLDEIGIRSARMVISTSPDIQDNLALLAYLKSSSHRPRVIVRAENNRDAQYLYRRGADYVIVPSLTAGHYIGEILSEQLIKGDHLWRAREKDYKIMKKEVWN